MKTQILLSLVLIFQINSLSYTFQEIVHIDSELAKICTLADKTVLVLSSVRGQQKTKESKLDKDGEVIYGNSTLDFGYTGSAQLVQPKAVNNVQPDNVMIYHNKQNLGGKKPNEFYMKFKQGSILKNENKKDSIYQQKSVVALKNGKVLVAGIEPSSSYGANTNAEANIYDPITNTYGNGLTFNDAQSKYISCFELKANNVYCVYVSYEYYPVSKLRIKHIKVNNMTLTSTDNENKKVIKTFYTDFNFIKAIPFNEKEALVLFQTGNNKKYPKYGNTGMDLYFYHLEITEDEVHVKRYEYLTDKCIYREDAEDYNADIAVLSQNYIYVTCEMQTPNEYDDITRLHGFIIYQDKDKPEIEEFNFNNFDAMTVRNPAFAKFGDSLGIFYTHNNLQDNAKVAFHIMNYPDCFNYREVPLLLPKHFTTTFELSGKVFMNNPYPARRADEEIDARFSKIDSNLKFVILKDNKAIEENKDYDESLVIKVSSSGDSGIHSAEYTATRDDPYDGRIIGKTCKINFLTPKCLDNCYSCVKTGTAERHECLGCAEGPYYKEDVENATITDFGKAHNCPACNISCSSCYGPFRFTPKQTTNCIKCDYKNGYYHFVEDETVCISYGTQDNWENYFNRSIYLDNTGNDTSKWRWKFCHKNCKKCHGPGDDDDNQCEECIDDYYFYCNQTKGNGIPGTCHNDCVDNGFFIKENEGMKKCCPCLPYCKKCPNENLCDNCFKPYFLLPDKDQCVPDCPYCLAEDKTLWECVNCRTKFAPKELYNLNGTCVDESKLPIISEDPDLIGRKHHVVDETCNLLIGCKEGCHKCEFWYTDNCTQCSKNFYREDHYGTKHPEPDVFKCFTEDECTGMEPYRFDKSLQIGGVPKTLLGEEVCYNCRLREGEDSYRQVEPNFVCGPKAKRTYVNITYYNKLSSCYLRCKECRGFGNSCKHNCLGCRDSLTYELVKYKNSDEGDCIRYSHKCKDLPYYHDYDLAEKLGINEDSCGQDCDVCLTNRTCTENFPYYVVETRECVEVCPLTDILNQKCLMDHPRAGFILLQNPLDLPNLYTPINQTIDINQIISTAFFQKFIEIYNIDINEINNYFGNGKIYNLQNSQIIIGNNISIELTSVKLELEKLAKIFSQKEEPKQTETYDNKNINLTSTIDLSECSKILKKRYGIPEEEDLMIIKGDLLKNISSFMGTQTDYQIFSTSLGAFLPLSACEEEDVDVPITNPFSYTNFLNSFSSKTAAVLKNGYDAYNPESPFFTDVCTPFTNENGQDVLLDERIRDYFDHNDLCDNDCTYNSFNYNSQTYTCTCKVKASPTDTQSEITTKKEKKIPDYLYKRHKNSNIEVIKCASQVFSSKGQKKNFGSYTLLLCLASFIGAVVYYAIKGGSKMNIIYNDIVQNSIANPPKPEPITSKVKISHIKNVSKDSVMNNEQLNYAKFNIAKNKDKRSYLSMYWSFLKMKQLIIFTFYTYTDYNLSVVKIALFILFVSFYFVFTALFFNDNIMRQIYIYKGNTDAAVHIPNIILSSLCCLIMNFIVRFISLNERDISKINWESNQENKNKLAKKSKKLFKIKLIIFFALAGALIAFCWYYVAAFCAVFKNSQGHYFLNVFFSFIVCNLWPFVTSLIASIFRRLSIKNNSSVMYKVSQIIAYI